MPKKGLKKSRDTLPLSPIANLTLSIVFLANKQTNVKTSVDRQAKEEHIQEKSLPLSLYSPPPLTPPPLSLYPLISFLFLSLPNTREISYIFHVKFHEKWLLPLTPTSPLPPPALISAGSCGAF
jgi:hypothetical protein